MILLLESLHADAERRLEEVAPVLRDGVPEDTSGIRAILTRGKGRIDAALLGRCPGLEVIARAGAGLDNLDTRAAAERGIVVIHAPGLNASTVAEHTLALMLDVTRGVSRWNGAVKRGGWNERAGYGGSELRGMTLGIVGYGNIGRRVAALARAFGMRVVVASRTLGASRALVTGRGMATDDDVERLPFDELLGRVDVVSLHVPLTDATRGLLGPDEFARLRDGAFVVNTSRGAVVDGDALRAAIAGGRLGGYAADVLDVQPPEDGDPLLASERVVLTPHVASLTGATYRELCRTTAENVVRVLQGEEPALESVFVARP